MPSRSSLRGFIVFAAVWAAAALLLVAGIYEGLALWVTAWREHPELAEGATFGVCVVAALISLPLLQLGRGEWRSDNDADDEDGGGGQRPPSGPPVPRGPGGAVLDWDGFDRARADWDRVGAGC